MKTENPEFQKQSTSQEVCLIKLYFENKTETNQNRFKLVSNI